MTHLGWDPGHTHKLLFMNKEREGNEVKSGSSVHQMCRCRARKLGEFVLDGHAFFSDVEGIYWVANKCQAQRYPNPHSLLDAYP